MQITIRLWEYPWRDRRLPEFAKTIGLRKQIDNLFAPYGVRRGGKTSLDHDRHFLKVDIGDPNFEKLLGQFKKLVKRAPKVGGSVSCSLSDSELGRAKLLPVNTNIDVDSFEDKNGNILAYNRFRQLCKVCSFPDLANVPDPFVVSEIAARRREQILGTDCGLFIVRQKGYDLLRDAIGEQIDTGRCKVVKGKSEALYWIRPKHELEIDPERRVWASCKKCGRPTSIRNRHSPVSDSALLRLTDERKQLDNLGGGKIDIARHKYFVGGIDSSQTGFYTQMAISGALWRFLADNKLHGLIIPDKTCFFSRTEPSFESSRRTLGAADEPQHPLEPSSGTVRKLAGLPWGHERDGYIYLHLTTPDIVMCDPMIMDTASAMPTRVRHFRPGIYRFPVTAIRAVRSMKGLKQAVPVDSASLVFCDAEFFAALANAFAWEQSTKRRKDKWAYYQKIAEQIGSRFGFCEAPGVDSGCEFEGDGAYRLDASKIQFVK